MCRLTRLLPLLIASALTALAGCGDDPTAPPAGSDTLTVTFRDASRPYPSYLGTRDAVIKDGPGVARRSENNGMRAVDTLGVTEIGGGLYQQRLLIRFDLTSITDCGSVTGATLTLAVTPADTNDTVILYAYEATVPESYPGNWEEGSLSGGVSWDYLDGVSRWDSPGGDVIGLMDSGSVKSDTAVTFELEPARVERWIKTPTTNHGLLITPDTPGAAFVYVWMREAPEASRRPVLTVSYLRGG